MDDTQWDNRVLFRAISSELLDWRVSQVRQNALAKYELSEQETQILRMLRDGASASHVADQLGMSKQFSATLKLSSRWQAGALIDANVTPGRDEQFAALAFLRYFFEPRAGVFSRDLPRNTRDFYLQLDDNHN